MRKTVMAIALLALLVTPGCSGEAAAIGAVVAGGGAYLAYREVGSIGDSILYAAGKEAAILGLKSLPKEIAPDVARVTVVVCDNMLTFLQSGQTDSVAINKQLTECLSELPDSLQAEVRAAAHVLDEKAAVGSTLTPGQISFIVAFVTGLRDGCNAWIADNSVSVKVKWTKGNRKAKVAATGWFRA